MSEFPVLSLPVRPVTPKWEVVVDRDLPLRGQCQLNQRKIVLRTWDEEVLLHECLHALLHEGQLTSIPGYGDDRRARVSAVEEDLVSHLSHGLMQMGWRFVELEQDDGTIEGENKT